MSKWQPGLEKKLVFFWGGEKRATALPFKSQSITSTRNRKLHMQLRSVSWGEQGFPVVQCCLVTGARVSRGGALKRAFALRFHFSLCAFHFALLSGPIHTFWENFKWP